MRKSEVAFHSEGYSPARPAVNVKCYKGIESVDFSQFHADADPGFTLDWVRENVSDERVNDSFSYACERQWEQVEIDAEECFGKGAKVYAEGRSGGWAVVDGLPPFESWDAIMTSRWSQFSKLASGLAADIPYQIVDDLCYNLYIPAKEAATESYIEEVTNNAWSAGV